MSKRWYMNAVFGVVVVETLLLSYVQVTSVAQHEAVGQLRANVEVEKQAARALLAENRRLKSLAAEQCAGDGNHVGLAPDREMKVTAVLMSYPGSDRFHRLTSIVQEVRTWEFVVEVLLVWNGNESQVPAVVRDLESAPGAVPFRVLPQNANRLDNRWKIGRHVTSEGVLNLDDDVDIRSVGASCLHRVWQAAPDRLVTIDVRAHSDSKSAVSSAEKRSGAKVAGATAYTPRHVDAKGVKHYSIALPRALMGHRKYWLAYEAAESRVRAIVDELMCDDIAFNFVVANASGAGPIYARAPFAPFPESQSANSLQKLKNMRAKRQQCISRLTNAFGGTIPLKHMSWYAACSWDGESGNHGKK
ncbi:Exostosin-2 [Diplonema papillatum]|nr:Exostosin-2 [Diplonema papillatum]